MESEGTKAYLTSPDPSGKVFAPLSELGPTIADIAQINLASLEGSKCFGKNVKA